MADGLPSGPGRRGAFNWIVTLVSNKADKLIGHDQQRASESSVVNIANTQTEPTLQHYPIDVDPLMIVSPRFMVALGLNYHELHVLRNAQNLNMVIRNLVKTWKNLSNMAQRFFFCLGHYSYISE